MGGRRRQGGPGRRREPRRLRLQDLRVPVGERVRLDRPRRHARPAGMAERLAGHDARVDGARAGAQPRDASRQLVHLHPGRRPSRALDHFQLHVDRVRRPVQRHGRFLEAWPNELRPGEPRLAPLRGHPRRDGQRHVHARPDRALRTGGRRGSADQARREYLPAARAAGSAGRVRQLRLLRPGRERRDGAARARLLDDHPVAARRHDAGDDDLHRRPARRRPVGHRPGQRGDDLGRLAHALGSAPRCR